ncbi:hypothetical protein [Flavobacterium subsaxonicum]|uniref:Uncharacterized protein n=1 Tax=Flavobacterium subsaxonicum WB 4.1-42 = DSM 21790 TaxID=1121898 RepID=A0A0A2MTX1_9FLAO|nr:hypothetical protein [Flavobacterium subsaxonicum]KGO94928.1 hypothetical protein Q766_02100 [Flavobacterium subsaxonicum WB 4.1-42 = DSM 21790]
MLESVRNSVFGKCLQVLLIGYFLISSLNASNTVTELLTQNTHITSAKGIISNILKKIFKCDGCTEEYEELDAKNKAEKANKAAVILDYLLPDNACIAANYLQATIKDKAFIANPVFIFGFYSKIYLPPPEFIA